MGAKSKEPRNIISHFRLCPWPFALRPLHSALSPFHLALCSWPFAADTIDDALIRAHYGGYSSVG